MASAFSDEDLERTSKFFAGIEKAEQEEQAAQQNALAAASAQKSAQQNTLKVRTERKLNTAKSSSKLKKNCCICGRALTLGDKSSGACSIGTGCGKQRNKRAR